MGILKVRDIRISLTLRLCIYLWSSALFAKKVSPQLLEEREHRQRTTIQPQQSNGSESTVGRNKKKAAKQSNEIKLSSSWSFHCIVVHLLLYCVFYDGKIRWPDLRFALPHLIAISFVRQANKDELQLRISCTKSGIKWNNNQMATVIERMKSNSWHECISKIECTPIRYASWSICKHYK